MRDIGKICRLLPLFTIALAHAQGAENAPAGAKTVIPVTLFGGSCQLSGPFSESVLSTIHSISPEKIPPDPNEQQTAQALDRLKSAKNLPASLELYREKQSHRLEGAIAFFEAVKEAKKTGTSLPLKKTFEARLNDRRLAQLSSMLNQLNMKSNPSGWSPSQISELSDAYLLALGQSPDEDFHRSIQKLGVQYTCSYGENESDEDNSSSPEPSKPSPAPRSPESSKKKSS